MEELWARQESETLLPMIDPKAHENIFVFLYREMPCFAAAAAGHALHDALYDKYMNLQNSNI